MRAFGVGRQGLRAAVVVAATSLFMVLVAWATLIGPDEVFTGPGPTPSTLTTTTATCDPTPVAGSDVEECPEPDTTRQDAEDLVTQSPPPLWLKVLVWILLGALLAVVAALVVFLLLQARHLVPRRTEGERTQVDFATLDEPTRLAAAIADDAVAQDGLLREGDPRNAIVAAWLRFEVQGASVGMQRATWETSSEYALRILDVVDADSGAVNRLAGLYREARFSDHPLDETHRAAALAALAEIRRSLQART